MIHNHNNNSFVLFTDQEKNQIMKDYNDIITSSNPLKDYPKEKFINAAKGMYLNINKLEKKSKEELYSDITDKEKHDPIVQNDSLTAWGNQAVEQFGLEIRDILAMKPGQKMRVILMDRNVGDYIDFPEGTVYDPRKEGFSYADYIHQEGLRGRLKMDVLGYWDCFEWELNGGCESFFWGPISSPKTYKNFDPKTKVGWRGPAINMENAKYLPKTVVHYGDWWNDYLPYRYSNFLEIYNKQKGGNDYYQKYLKYKTKYLNLKN